MSLTHAVIWTDRHTARVLLFDSEHMQAQKVRERGHYTRQHHSGVRTEQEFFGKVCDAAHCMHAAGESVVSCIRLGEAPLQRCEREGGETCED